METRNKMANEINEPKIIHEMGEQSEVGHDVFAPNLTRQAKQMVYKVYTYFKEKEQKDSTSTEFQEDENINKLVAQVTGVSLRNVRETIEECNELKRMHNCVVFPYTRPTVRKKRYIIDAETKLIVKQRINDYYLVHKKYPTTNVILVELYAERIQKCSREPLRECIRQTLRKMGHVFKKRKPYSRKLKEQPTESTSSTVSEDLSTVTIKEEYILKEVKTEPFT